MSGAFTARSTASIPQILLPPISQDIEKKDGYWFLSYSFQQYLVQNSSNPAEGWGIFGQIAVSDGNPNPIQWSGFIGLGGTSFIPDRPEDRFGIAYFHNGLSGHLKDGLDAFGVDLRMSMVLKPSTIRRQRHGFAFRREFR